MTDRARLRDIDMSENDWFEKLTIFPKFDVDVPMPSDTALPGSYWTRTGAAMPPDGE